LLLRLAALAALWVGGVVPAFAYSLYDYSVQGQLSSLTIAGATHGFGSTHLAVRVKYADGTIATLGAYSYSVDSSSYDVSLNFSPSLTFGAHVYLWGALGSNTTASTDFAFTGGANTLTICASCSTSAVAQRAKDSKKYTMAVPVVFTWDTAPNTTMDVRVYILDNVIVFAGYPYFPLAHCSSPACRIDGAVNDFPYGSIPLGHTTWTGSSWGWLSDDRPPSFQ